MRPTADPEDPLQLANLGAALFAEGRTDDACRALARAAELSPDDPRIAAAHGRVLLGAGRLDETRVTLRRAWELAPGNREIGVLYATALASERPRDPSRIQEAILVLQHVLENRTDESGESWAQLYFLLATLHDDQEDGYDSAIRAYESGLAEDPRSVAAHNNLGAIHLHRGNHQEALSHLLTALELEPGHRKAQQNLAKLLFYRMPDTEASQVFQHIVERETARAGEVLFRVARGLVQLATHEAHTEIHTRAHQIKNMLGLVTSRAGRMLRELDATPPPPLSSVKPRLEGLHGEAEKLYGMMIVLLKFIRPDPIDPVALDLRVVLRREVDRFRASYGNEVRFRVTVPRGLPRIVADPDGLLEILDNLLTNAVESTLGAHPEGCGSLARVAVDVKLDAGRRRVAIRVSDNGPGLDAGVEEKDLYMAGFTTKEGGSGLGLSICRRIARDHGGDIRHDPGKPGAHFVVELPLDPMDRIDPAIWSRQLEPLQPETFLADELA